MKKTQLFTLLFVLVSFSILGQKTKPTTVKYMVDDNTTVMSFKKEKDFILSGKWEKYTETEDQRKYYLRDTNSYQVGISKVEQKKTPFYKKGISATEYLDKYIEVVDGFFPSDKYNFIVLEEEESVDFKYYKVIEIESNLDQNYSQEINPKFVFRTINLVGLKNGIVYDLSLFLGEFKESNMKVLLRQLFDAN